MAQSNEQEEGQAATGLRWATRPGIQFGKRRRMAVAKLGGRRPGRVVTWGRMVRKIRLRWVKLKCIAMVKKMKRYYRSFMKDVIEGGGAYANTYQHKLILETSFAIPVLGVSFFAHSTQYATTS